MIGFPNQQVLQLTAQRVAQTRQGFKVDVAHLAGIQPVNKVFGYTSLLCQTARRKAFSGCRLLFPKRMVIRPDVIILLI